MTFKTTLKPINPFSTGNLCYTKQNIKISKEKHFFQQASSHHFHPHDVESLVKKKMYFISWEELNWDWQKIFRLWRLTARHQQCYGSAVALFYCTKLQSHFFLWVFIFFTIYIYNNNTHDKLCHDHHCTVDITVHVITCRLHVYTVGPVYACSPYLSMHVDSCSIDDWYMLSLSGS